MDTILTAANNSLRVEFGGSMRYDHSYVVGQRRQWAAGAHLTRQSDLDAMSVSLRLTCDGDFDATLWTGQAGTMIFVRYAGVPLQAERTAQHLGDMLSGYVMLTVVLRGHWAGFQGGREFDATAGEAMATRFDQTFLLLTKSPDIDTLEIYYPLSMFGAAGVNPEEVNRQSWTLSTLTMSAIEFVIAALDDSSMNHPIRAARLDGMMVRTAMLILDDFRIATHGTVVEHDDVRMRVIDLIGADFRDPELSAETIAKRLSISPRSLFRAFEKSGLTINQLIRDTRLDHAAFELAEAGSTKTIAAIAHSHGFSGADTFSRAFRLRFHESPSQFRRRTRVPVTT